MRFETLVVGEARQLDGPFYGVKVLNADPTQGATLTVNDVTWSLLVLPSESKRIDRMKATGPMVLVVAENIDDDVRTMAAAPQPAVLTRTVYDSGNVAAGALIQPAALDVSRLATVIVRADNLAGVAARNLTMTLLEEDGLTVVEALPVQVVALGTRSLFAFGPAVTATGLTAAWSLLAPKLSLSLAAGGAQVGRLIVVGRP
jgi:hypothetical protein